MHKAVVENVVSKGERQVFAAETQRGLSYCVGTCIGYVQLDPPEFWKSSLSSLPSEGVGVGDAAPQAASSKLELWRGHVRHIPPAHSLLSRPSQLRRIG